jgi:hypothetical protein
MEIGEFKQADPICPDRDFETKICSSETARFGLPCICQFIGKESECVIYQEFQKELEEMDRQYKEIELDEIKNIQSNNTQKKLLSSDGKIVFTDMKGRPWIGIDCADKKL